MPQTSPWPRSTFPLIQYTKVDFLLWFRLGFLPQGSLSLVFASFWVTVLSHGNPKHRTPSTFLPLELNIDLLLLWHVNCNGYTTCCKIYVLSLHPQLSFSMTTKVPSILLKILFSMKEPNTLTSIVMLFDKNYKMDSSVWCPSPPPIKLQTSSVRPYHKPKYNPSYLS